MVERRAGRTACKILQNQQIADGIFELVLQWPKILDRPTAGQFVNLYCTNRDRLLPRPISVCEIDEDKLHLVYAVLGKGTAEFTTFQAGGMVDLLGPFGNGFSLKGEPGRALLVSGGVGTPPMVELAKQLKARGWSIDAVCGFRSQSYLVEQLSRYGSVHIATDSGAEGFSGNVIELLDQEALSGDALFACGPGPMLKGVQAWAKTKGIPAQLSLEERMGCGFGACVGCVTKIAADNESGFTYKKVCKDGPVFPAAEVLFQ